MNTSFQKKETAEMMNNEIWVCKHCENPWPSTDVWYCKYCNTPYRVTKTIKTTNNIKMNTLKIFMGIPGSGKTTRAKKIANVVFEADNYWLNCVGEYLFVPTKIGQAHQWCQSEVRKAMEDGKTSIAVANTSLTPKERKPYIDLAKEFGYEVSLELPDSPWFLEVLPRLRNKTFTDDDVWTFVRKNTHGVPFDSIKNMMNRWDETFNIE